MNLFKTSVDILLAMPYEDKLKLILENIEDSGQACEYALLLGMDTSEAIVRATYAAELYRKGRVRRIISSGGVLREYNGKMVSECHIMADVLMKNGVPSDAIIIEDRATTTRENMIFGTLLLNRATRLAGVDKLTVITSVWHMKRSLGLARCFLPRKVRAIGAPAPLPCDESAWLASVENRVIVDNEIRFLKDLQDNKIIEEKDI